VLQVDYPGHGPEAFVRLGPAQPPQGIFEVFFFLGSVIKKRRKKMRKHKHKKMLKKTRWQRRAT
jgi:hypothetical protein